MASRKPGRPSRRNSYYLGSRKGDDWTVQPPVDEPQHINGSHKLSGEHDEQLPSTSCSIYSLQNSCSNEFSTKITMALPNSASKKHYNQRNFNWISSNGGNNKAVKLKFVPKSEVGKFKSGGGSDGNVAEEREKDQKGAGKAAVVEREVFGGSVESPGESSQHADDWTVQPPLDEPQHPNISGSHKLSGEHNEQLPSTSASVPSHQNSCSNGFSTKITMPLSNSASKKHYNKRNSKWTSSNRGNNKAVNPKFVPKSELGVLKSRGGSNGNLVEERESEANRDDGHKGAGKSDVVEREVFGGSVESPGESSQDADDVFSRLERIQLGAEEVELSEEQMQINDQAQEDELLVMESIYGENLYILDKMRGLRYFQVHVHVELPEELIVSETLSTASGPGPKTDGSDEFSYSFNVQYLPPILLTLLLPRSYPSHCSPFFTMSVQWLNSARISKLCSMLDSLWNEQPGQVILYEWTERLRSSSLAYLGFDKEIVLGPYGTKFDADQRALSWAVSPEVDIPSLKSYNEERRYANFLIDLHQCDICFSEYAGTKFITFPCQHFFCMACMKTFTDMHVKEGTVHKILCPSPKCGGMLPPGLLKYLLGGEEYERLESLMLQKALDARSDVAYCPRCETACFEDDSQHAQCSKCFFSFCTLCRERRHVGQECMSPEMKLQILQERQNSSQLQGSHRHKEKERINEMLSVKEIMRDSKRCPSCKMAISKTEGCNKMVCYNCGQYFCYHCNAAIADYEHFRGGACELFSTEEIQRWEAHMNDRQREGQIQVELFPNLARPCPNCRQLNAKVGNNNHIFCWACQSHYCYLCRKVVKRASQHYGPKGCKQHTVG